MERATNGAAREGVRTLKSLPLLFAAAAVVGCGERPADPAAADPPPGSGAAQTEAREATDMQFWSAQAIGVDGALGEPVLLCADSGIRRAFSQGVPAVNGKGCRMEGPPVESEGLYSGRCSIGDQLYVFRTVTDADPDGSVVVHSLVREVGARGMAVSRSRLFRPLGACPAGWQNGDSAAPNATQVRNVISDETRSLDSHAPAAPSG